MPRLSFKAYELHFSYYDQHEQNCEPIPPASSLLEAASPEQEESHKKTKQMFISEQPWEEESKYSQRSCGGISFPSECPCCCKLL